MESCTWCGQEVEELEKYGGDRLCQKCKDLTQEAIWEQVADIMKTYEIDTDDLDEIIQKYS